MIGPQSSPRRPQPGTIQRNCTRTIPMAFKATMFGVFIYIMPSKNLSPDYQWSYLVFVAFHNNEHFLRYVYPFDEERINLLFHLFIYYLYIYLLELKANM